MKNSYKPLDKYEERLKRAVENDELVPIKNQKAELKRMSAYFKQLPRKDKRITIRVNEADLAKIQQKAVQNGIPYQSLISAILRRFAQGKVKIGI
ncbi:MAG: CopG family antitoxin [Candidatus Paceibacterota bacterium]